MNVTLIGVSTTFARGFADWAVAAGHDLTVVGWNRASAEASAEGVGARRSAGPSDPLRDSLIFLALPYVCLRPVLESYGGELDGKVLVDLIVPFDLDTMEPIHPEAGSTAQEIALARPGARVVKAFSPRFNPRLAGTLAAPQGANRRSNVLLAGGDDEAKRIVAQLFEASGLRASDVGPLRRARELEALGYLHVAVPQHLHAGIDAVE